MALEDGKYEESVAFTTDHFEEARSKSNPYGFQVRGCPGSHTQPPNGGDST